MKFYLHDIVAGKKLMMREGSIHSLGAFICGADGFWMFFPNTDNKGGMNELFLKKVLGFLKELNEPIAAQLENDMRRLA